MRKWLAPFTVLTCLLLLTATPASAGGTTGNATLDTITAALGTNPVYVSPSSPNQLSATELSALTAQIRSKPIPIYIALLPDADVSVAGGNYDLMPNKIGQVMGNATVGVTVGNKFRAGSSALASGQAAALATDAFNAFNPGKNGGAVYPMLTDFVTRAQNAAAARVSTAPAGTAASTATTTSSSKSGGTSGLKVFVTILVTIVGLLLGGGLAALIIKSRRRKKAKAELEDEMAVLSNSVLDESLSAELVLHPEAKQRYEEAVSAYQRARNELNRGAIEAARAAIVNSRSGFESVDDLIHGRKDRHVRPARLPRAARVEAVTSDHRSYSRPRADYDRHYAGGNIGGTYYPPGYYNSDFWLLYAATGGFDHHNHDSHHHRDDTPVVSSPSHHRDSDWTSSPSPSVSDWSPSPSIDSGSSFDSGSGGGGDW